MNDEVLKRLDALAEKLGTTGAHLWDVLIKEARIEAIECICWAILCAVLGCILALVARRIYKRDDDDLLPFFQLCCVGSGCVFFVAFVVVSGTPGMFLNPEYWALKQIFEAMKR